MRRQRANTQMIHARIDGRLKKSAAGIFSQIGISTAEAIRLFLKQVELHRGLPFLILIPNEETVAAMTDASVTDGCYRVVQCKMSLNEGFVSSPLMHRS